MMKKKKQSRSQSSTKKTFEPSPDSSPSPRLLSIFRSKLVSGKDLKHMFRGMKTKTTPGLSSQSRIVRCPKCHKLLQEPIDATIYKCSGCNSILQAKRWDLESNGDSIPEALLYSQNRSLSTQLESAEEDGSKTPMRSTHREYTSRASPSVERGYHSETVYKHERSDVHREWMRRADEFSVDSDAFASARSSPAYNNSRSNASEHERRYQVPFYPASPSPSSHAYEYGYNSPFHGSQASASDKSYYHHQPNQFKQKDRGGWFQESSAASPIRFPGETSDGKHYHWSSQSQYHNLYEPSSSMYSERSYQAANRSQYSDHSKSGTSREKKSSQRDKKKDVRKRNHVVKRYVLPSAGGAPFATCSYCLELLQLPQVSLHGKHKGYQVRCGSCSGVLKFSVREKADNVLDSHSLAEETVTNHQDSASEGHEEIYPDESHLSCSDNGSGDGICKSNDDVILRQDVETFEEDKGSKEDIMRISNTLQLSMNDKLREQQPASSECEGDSSRNHLEQDEEACSEKSTEMDNNICERVSCGLEEAGLYEKNELLKPESILGDDGSGETLEVPVYKNERMSDSGIESETVAAKTVSNSGETRVLSENIGDSQELGWEETQEKEENGGEGKWEDMMGDKPGLMNLEKSQCIGDSICDSSSINGEAYEDTTVKKDTDLILAAAPQNENQRFIGHPDQSGEAIATTSRTHEEQSKFDRTINDNVRYELEESRYKTSEALDIDKVSEDGSDVSPTEAGEMINTSIEGERSVSHQTDLLNENVEDSYEKLVYAGERTWAETLEDRAGLHLEEYESKPFEWTSNGAPTFHVHEYECELGTIDEPEEDADGRLESSSRGSSSDHESAEETAVCKESQDADQSKYEYEIPSGRQELSNTVFDTVGHELQEEDSYETYETFEAAKMVGDGSVVSLEKESETNIGEAGEEMSVFHQMASENENLEAMGDGAELQLEEYHNNPHEWTSERALTFRMHEHEVGTMHVSEEDAEGRPYSSVDFSSDHETSEEKAVAHEEHSLVDENKSEELTVEDGSSLHLEKCGSNSMKLEETFEWTSERAPTFRLHEYELGTRLEPDEDADGRSESSSPKERETDHEEEPRLVIDSRTKEQQVDEVARDTVPLHLEWENESMKLNETFEWTSERALTFRHREYELETMLEPDEDASGHGVSKERADIHEPPQHLEKCEDEKVVLDRTLEPRDDTLRLCLDDTLEQERITFHLEKSQDKQVNLRQTFAQENMAEVDSEAEEDMLGDHLEHLKIENEKSGLTSEPYSHLFNTTDPSEIVGLRLALYETQTSPLSSPMHTPPTGSPLHILMRSPIASPMHPHIVSPMRSPINSYGSLSDVLFFGKKA